MLTARMYRWLRGYNSICAHAYPAKYGFGSCSISLIVPIVVLGLFNAKGDRAGDSLLAKEKAELKTLSLVSLSFSPGKELRCRGEEARSLGELNERGTLGRRCCCWWCVDCRINDDEAGEGEGGAEPSGVLAPGISRNFTLRGSVVDSAGEIVPPSKAVAVFIGDEDPSPLVRSC